MSNIALITLTEQARDCNRCEKTIEIGEKAVKAVGRASSSGGSWPTTVYLHEGCWKPKRNQYS